MQNSAVTGHFSSLPLETFNITLNLGVHILYAEKPCLVVVLAEVESGSFSTCQNVKPVNIRTAITAGANARTTFGGNAKAKR
ncbi:MAG: hypothetical protein QW175_03465 [Candidatus Bathyarchaeia archaeon]